ncbi:MAG TPA: LptA/OstA family protein [Povalibacter sp.]|jgi:lipopolysaccharide transport protein LptA
MAVPKRADAIAGVLAAAAVAAMSGAHAATPTPSTEGINIAADLQEADLRNDVHVLTGNVSITQADMSMEADKATVKGLQTDNGRWTFERAVHIRSAKADLRADTADAVFASGRVAEATVKGAPALFEQLNAAADKKVSGRAKIIQYDFGKGTVRMSEDVWFSYGGNEFRGDTVVYSLNDERVVVNPGATQGSGGRVHITVKPGSVPSLPGSQNKPKAPATPEKGGSTE